MRFSSIALGAPYGKDVVRSLGHGKATPVASNGTARGRSLNRRVEIRFR